jgi:flagellar assembly factor FliW
MTNNRFYLTNRNNYLLIIKAAIEFGQVFAKEYNLRLVILTATRKSEALEKGLGKEKINIINRSGKLNGISTSLETLNTYQYSKQNDIVVGLYLPPKEYDKIDSIMGDSPIIATEFYEGELSDWVKRWNAIDIENPERENPSLQIDCILKVALENLTKMINLSTGLSHNSDNNLAKTYIRTLVKYHKVQNREDINSYLIKNHWRAKDAKQFVDLLFKKLEGGRFQGGEKTGLKKIYDRWVQECEN